MLRLAVDCDGTLVERSVRPLRWRPGAKAALQRISAAGHVLILHTCRANPPTGDAGLLGERVRDLDLKIAGRVQRCIQDVLAELREREITFEPHFFLGDNDFWTSDRAISINVPWFLADKRTWEIADRTEDFEYSPEDAERCLRHEIGHALNYAFELWKRPDWTAVFGDFEAPYADDFTPDAEKAGDFVEYLTDVPEHYAQKHPDEAWAEAFAFWLDQRTDASNLEAGALRKMEYVEEVAAPILRGDPTVTRLGRPIPYTRIRGTVGQVLDAVDEDEETKREWVEMIAFLKAEGVLPLFNEIWRSPGKPEVDLMIDDRSERPGNWRELADEFGASKGDGTA